MKIIVTIEIGRSSLGCSRFGICRITVGAELALKPNQDVGIIEWEPGTASAILHWRGKESLVEQGICAILIDRATHVPLPCQDADWLARHGRYTVQRNETGEYIELKLTPIYPV